jgi:transcriptional regulator with XRE-family HTH domain
MEWTDDHTDEDQGSGSDLNQQSSDLFKKLQEIRKQKKLSLESIAENSRVQLKYLRALEEGDLTKVPEVYDKLFFRSYLKALGIPEEEYYEQFLAYRRSIRLDKTTTVFNFSDGSQENRRKFNQKNLLYLLPIFVVIILIWVLLRNTESIDSRASAPVDEIDVRDAGLEQKQQVSADSDTIAVRDSLRQFNLQIRGLKRTWFRVISDHKDTSEYMLPAGNIITLQAYTCLEFLIGRADGLSIKLDNGSFQKLGKDSTVIQYMLVDSTGIVTKRFLSPR